MAVKFFSATGPHSALGKGLSDMVLTELTALCTDPRRANGACKPTIVEWEHRAELEREIELSNSELFDPATRIPRGHLINPDVFVTGSVTTTQADTSWTLKLVNANTGAEIGGDDGSAKSEAIFDVSPGIAERLLDQLCKWWSKN